MNRSETTPELYTSMKRSTGFNVLVPVAVAFLLLQTLGRGEKLQ